MATPALAHEAGVGASVHEHHETNMTEQEAKERCNRLGLRIRQLPCKAWHLIGNGIDLVITDLRILTDRDLQRYEEPDDEPA